MQTTQFEHWFALSDEDLERKCHECPELIDTPLILHFKSRAEQAADSGDLPGALTILARAECLTQAAADPLLSAYVWRGRANVLQRHERLPEALEAAQCDAALCEQHGAPLDVAKARTIQVYILGTLGHFQTAIETALQIRPLYIAAQEWLGQANLAMNLAQVYTLTWQFAEALHEYDIALTLYERLGKPVKMARVWHNQALVLEQSGDLAAAAAHYQRAYPYFVQAEDVYMIAKTQYNLAMLAIRAGRYDQTLQHLAQARADLKRLGEVPDLGYVDWFEAGVRRELHQSATANTLLRQAITRFETAGYIIDLALVSLELGQLLAETTTPAQLLEGLTWLEQARRNLDATQTPYLVAWTQIQQGEILLRLERNAEAAQEARAALATFAEQPLRLAQAQMLLADSLQHFASAEAEILYRTVLASIGVEIPLLAARCWIGLGRLAAQRLATTQAESNYTRALNLLDEVRRSLRSQAQQAGFLARRQALMEALLSLHQDAGAEYRLWYWLEQFKASVLADWLADVWQQPPDTALLDAQYHALLVERQRLTRELDLQTSHYLFLTQSDQDLTPVAPIVRATGQLKQTHTLIALRQQLQRTDEQLAHYQHVPLTRAQATREPSAIQALLAPDTVLISYYRVAEQWRALTLTCEPDDIHLHTLAIDAGELKTLWMFASRELLRRKDARPRLGRLWEGLIAPLLEHCQAYQRWVIIPYQDLFNIPFAALYNAQGGYYLSEHYKVQLVPSATVLRQAHRQPVGTLPPLLIGYPGECTSTNYLSHVEDEIQALQALYPNATTLWKAAATRSAVWQQLPQRQVVHIASHVIFQPTAPLETGVLLARSRWLRASDFYLHPYYLAGAPLVLSACESGRGQIAGGDLLGFTSALLYAGAPWIIASLWKVADAATARLMVELHRYLQAGQSAVAALRNSQLTMLQTKDYAHPYYWAGFYLIGDDRTITMML